MFESSLIALDPKKPRGKAWLSLPLAVALHLVVLVSLGFAQYWNVDKSLEWRTVGLVDVFPPSPPPPLPLDSGETKAQTSRESGRPVRHTSTVTQPKTKPETSSLPPIPGPTDSMSTTDTRSESQVNSTEDSGCSGNCTKSETESREKNETEVQPPGDGEPIQISGAVVRPVILSRVEPKYTELARRVHLEGTMILQAIIDEQGRVVDARVLKGLSMARSMGLEQEALDAVSRWRFRPATLHGRPVKVFYSLTVLFTLR